MPIMKL